MTRGESSHNDNSHAEMRGWLYKEKSKATAFGGDTNRRWFAIERIEGARLSDEQDSSSDASSEVSKDDTNLALCYYKSKAPAQFSSSASIQNEKCGWFFLADVEGVEQDAVRKWITIRHPSRTYRLMAPNHSEHNAWFEALTALCCGVKRNIRSDDNDVDGGKTAPEVMAAVVVDDISHEEAVRTEEEEDDETDGKGKEEDLEEEEESKAVTEMNFLRQLTGRPPLEKPAARPVQEKQVSPSPDSSRRANAMVDSPPPATEDIERCDTISRDNHEPESEQADALPDFISRWEHEDHVRVPSGEANQPSCDDDMMSPLHRESHGTVRSAVDRTYDHRMSSRPANADNVGSDSLNKRLGRAIEGNPTSLDSSDLAQVTMVEDVGLLFEEESCTSSDDDTVDLSLERHVRSHFTPKTPQQPGLASLGVTNEESEEESSMTRVDRAESATTSRAESATGANTITYIPPGLTPDKNFATEDWDEPSPEQPDSPAKSRVQAAKRREHYSSIQPDEDFVDADWDDM